MRYATLEGGIERGLRALGNLVIALAFAATLGPAAPQTRAPDHVSGRDRGRQERAARAPSAAGCFVDQVRYHGWEATRLVNEWVTLTFVPQLGGRLMQVNFGAHDYLFVNPRYDGRYFPPSEGAAKGKWFNYGGDKIWPLPEGSEDESHWIVASDELDDGIYQLTDISHGGRCAVRLEGPPDTKTGLRYSREVGIDSESPKISFHAVMKNITGHPIRWAVQSVTQYDTSDPHNRSDFNRHFWALTPVNPASMFNRKFDAHAGPIDHPSYGVRDEKLFALHWSYLEGEVGVDSPAGWVAVVDDLGRYAMVERFHVDPEAEYPERASVIFYINGPRFHLNDKGIPEMTSSSLEDTPYYMEAELNSPLVNLPPGGKYEFDTEWFPARAGAELVEVTDAGIIEKPLTASREPGSVRMRGQFGVFFAGRLVANCYDSRGTHLGTHSLLAVTPLGAVSLDETIVAPAGCARVAVHLIDEQQLDRGALGEVRVGGPATTN